VSFDGQRVTDNWQLIFSFFNEVSIMPSSGIIPVGTSGDAAVTAIAADPTAIWRNVIITNTGAAAGFFSLDGGLSWHYLPAQINNIPGGVFLNNQVIVNCPIQIKRVPGGTDLSGVYVSML
jgi:hypothetical protein